MNFATTKERILQFIDTKGDSQKDFLQKTDIKRGFLDGDKLNSAVNDVFIARIIAAYPDLNLEWLITGNGEMLKNVDNQTSIPQIKESRKVSLYNLKTDYFNERQEIPLYELSASAGLTTLFDNQVHEVPLDYIVVPNAPNCDGAVYARGDSMYPILKSGDIVCYKIIESLENIFYGEIYLLCFELEGDMHLTVKYIKKSQLGDDYVCLASQNKHHADADVHKSQIKALALVKLSIRYNAMM